jgi:tetratricopeptide (TPR) repeat protein
MIKIMAKKNEKQEEPIQFVEQTLTRTEQFIENNQKILTYIVAAIVIVILGFILIKKYYIGAKEVEAQNQIWAAQRYFESDSLDLAINGDGNYIGFNDIVNDYKWTKSSNLANYYIGISYLKQGEYELAIKSLKKFSTKSKLVSAMSLGAIGDSYMELNDFENALKYYKEAAEKNPNDFISPIFLMKAAFVYEEQKDYSNAIKMYEKVKLEHYKSMEGRDIEKYIARAKTLMES